ncbi:MAG TPA: hypothetical protein VK327_03660 [Candidatus Paceibacterota bacterium]|nr:hypothetical protein [Candidatus Paceibacterota bacterium]
MKESYDDNVFLSGVDRRYLPATYTVPSGSVAALENRSSWITTVSPKLGINFAVLSGITNTLQTLTFAYAPDFVTFHDASTESFNAHRFVAAIKGKVGAFSCDLENTFSYVDGSQFGPTYPGAFLSAFATSAVRERREQIQERGTVTLRYDFEKWFVRPTATVTYYDLQTAQLNVAGYQSYVDRYDANGGADFGYKFTPRMAATLGYRYGHQEHQQPGYLQYSSPSDYQRLLIGFEGRPWQWLEAKIQAGPDFRDYAADTATHITPVNDHHPVKYYGEASLTANAGAKDSITFKYKQYQSVSSTGRTPYFDSSYDLSYRRKLTDQLTFDLAGKILNWDYTSGNLATCRRDDRQYTVSTGVTCALNTHASLNLNYSLDLGRNMQDNVTNPSTREYERNIVSVGALVKF